MASRGKTASSPRRHERHLTEGLTCVTGDVLDLSTGGMRVRSNERPPAKPGAVASFTLRVGTKTLTLQGRVAWIKRASLLGGPFEYGIQFVGVTGAVGKVLDQIAMYGFVHDGKSEPHHTPSRDVGAAGPGSAHRSTGASDGSANTTGASEGAADSARPKVTVTADLPCFYQTLGVAFDATEAQVRAAFRQLAKKLHPDVCKEPDAAERFAFITRVYEVLSDEELRAKYDEAMAKRRVA
ncbi:MAG: DnaJ domain-containing protein [Phycisphaeraceae bacterium]|nr:DnaJ domain-containing protein [Phycisphaeraceae bacterium]